MIESFSETHSSIMGIPKHRIKRMFHSFLSSISELLKNNDEIKIIFPKFGFFEKRLYKERIGHHITKGAITIPPKFRPSFKFYHTARKEMTTIFDDENYLNDKSSIGESPKMTSENLKSNIKKLTRMRKKDKNCKY